MDPDRHTTAPDAAAVGVTDDVLRRLRLGNLALTVLHLGQAVVVLLLASEFAITVTETFPEGPPGSDQPASEPLFAVTIGWAVALFLALAAVDHLVTATVGRRAYERDLRRGVNRFRWVEYSVSATLMILLIASYAGITDVAALIGIAGANVAMILFGWLQERANPPGRASTTMQPFWFGSIAGSFPWIAIAVSIIGAANTGEGVPGFVYGIFFAQLVFFFSFAVNQWLQYREAGRWRSYGFGEAGYLVLSLGAKSVLAWQIFVGSLQGS